MSSDRKTVAYAAGLHVLMQGMVEADAFVNPEVKAQVPVVLAEAPAEVKAMAALLGPVLLADGPSDESKTAMANLIVNAAMPEPRRRRRGW